MRKSGRNAPSRVAPQEVKSSCPSMYLQGQDFFIANLFFEVRKEKRK